MEAMNVMRDPVVFVAVALLYGLGAFLYACYYEIKHERRFPWASIGLTFCLGAVAMFSYWLYSVS